MTKLKKRRKFGELLARVTHLIATERIRQSTWTPAEKLDYILSAAEDVEESKERWQLLFELDQDLFVREFGFRLSPADVESKLGWSRWSAKYRCHLPKIPDLLFCPPDHVPALLLEIFYMPMDEASKNILRSSPLLSDLKQTIAEHGIGDGTFPCGDPYSLHHDYGGCYPDFLLERHRRLATGLWNASAPFLHKTL